MIKFLYLANVVLAFFFLFTVKNLFNSEKQKNYSINEFEKKIKAKDNSEFSLNSIAQLSENELQQLPISTANIFDYGRVYPEVETKNIKKTSQAKANSASNNIEQKIENELKKIELLGIIIYDETKIATIKVRGKAIANPVKKNESKAKGKPQKKKSNEVKLQPNPTQSYQENDILPLGFKVIKINKKSVILAKNGFKKTLNIKGSEE
ncbi:hypothetical protein AAEX28_15845 [Lentisphaerota bacterium WC36G]|nr:hypothetical protein LJT99_02605 [Lentisphaerae bacterium WC36]